MILSDAIRLKINNLLNEYNVNVWYVNIQEYHVLRLPLF